MFEKLEIRVNKCGSYIENNTRCEGYWVYIYEDRLLGEYLLTSGHNLENESLPELITRLLNNIMEKENN